MIHLILNINLISLIGLIGLINVISFINMKEKYEFDLISRIEHTVR